MIKNRATALDAFMARKVEIDETLEQLRTLSDEHFNFSPDEIHWGHVGTITEIANALQRALKYADR